MGRVSDSVSYKVKNTFVEFGQADEVGYERVRARSDGTELNRGLLRGPQSPEEFAEFQAAQKARVVVPDTPSPFLHPSIPEHRGDMPLLSLAEPAAGHEVSAFGDIGPEELYGPGGAECFDAGDLPGFCYFPVPGMFDPSTGEFSAGGWYMSADGMVMAPTGAPGEADALAAGLGGQPLEALLEGQVHFEDAPQGAELQALAESGWGPEGGVQMEAGPAAEAPFGGGSSAQGWGPDGGVQAEEEQGQAAPAAEAAGGAEAWRQDAALQGPGDGRAWGKGGGQAEKEPASHEDGAWEEGRAGPAWGRKGGRGPRRQAQANGEGSPLGGARRPESGPPAPQGGGGRGAARSEAVVESSGPPASGSAPADGSFTTVMLRNIPNKYTREMLVKQLNSEFRGRFDFVYLPIDFKNRCNVGYGFINFRTSDACEEFVSKFNGVDVRKCLPGLNSRKVAEVTPARVQGLDENVRRLRNGPVMNELAQHPEWMPLLLGEDGEERKFPMPDQPCPPMKPRRRTGREEHGGGRAW